MLLLILFLFNIPVRFPDVLLREGVDGGCLLVGLLQVPVQAARCGEAKLGGDRGREAVDEQARLNKKQLL